LRAGSRLLRWAALIALSAVPTAAQSSGPLGPPSFAPPRPGPNLPLPNVVASSRGIAVTGTLVVNVTLYTSSELADGTTVYFTGLGATVSDPSFADHSYAYTQGTVAGGEVTVTQTIPYSWVVGALTDKVVVYGAGYALNFTQAPFYQYSASPSVTIPLPANGATTTVDIVGSL
jgi:hypothetical protein